MPCKLAAKAIEVLEQDSTLPSELVSSVTASIFNAATPPVTPAVQNGAVTRVDVNGKSAEFVKARNFSPDLGHGGGKAAAMNGEVRVAGGPRSMEASSANSLASSPFLSADGSTLTSPATSPMEPIASKASPLQKSAISDARVTELERQVAELESKCKQVCEERDALEDLLLQEQLNNGVPVYKQLEEAQSRVASLELELQTMAARADDWRRKATDRVAALHPSLLHELLEERLEQADGTGLLAMQAEVARLREELAKSEVARFELFRKLTDSNSAAAAGGGGGAGASVKWERQEEGLQQQMEELAAGREVNSLTLEEMQQWVALAEVDDDVSNSLIHPGGVDVSLMQELIALGQESLAAFDVPTVAAQAHSSSSSSSNSNNHLKGNGHITRHTASTTVSDSESHRRLLKPLPAVSTASAGSDTEGSGENKCALAVVRTGRAEHCAIEESSRGSSGVAEVGGRGGRGAGGEQEGSEPTRGAARGHAGSSDSSVECHVSSRLVAAPATAMGDSVLNRAAAGASRGGHCACASHFLSQSQEQLLQEACHSHCAVHSHPHSLHTTNQSKVSSAAVRAASADVSRASHARGSAGAGRGMGSERERERERQGRHESQIGQRLASAMAGVVSVTSAEEGRGDREGSKKRRQEGEGEGWKARDVPCAWNGQAAVSSATEGGEQAVDGERSMTRDEALKAIDLRAVERVEKMVGRVQRQNRFTNVLLTVVFAAALPTVWRFLTQAAQHVKVKAQQRAQRAGKQPPAEKQATMIFP